MLETSLIDMHDKKANTNSVYVQYGKRFVDIFISIVLVIITFPINLIIAAITFFDVGRPIFFTQHRVGKDGREFTIVKFRNMRNTFDEDEYLLPAAQRVTTFGKFVRATSLDELLQFWNILFGSMSIIGPRPLKANTCALLSNRHKARLSVRPGLECPMHYDLIHERTWQDQFENDVWYAENLSLKTDIALIIKLVKLVFNRKETARRSLVTKGSFTGYLNGEAITHIISDKERMKKKIDRLTKKYEAMSSEQAA